MFNWHWPSDATLWHFLLLFFGLYVISQFSKQLAAIHDLLYRQNEILIETRNSISYHLGEVRAAVWSLKPSED